MPHPAAEAGSVPHREALSALMTQVDADVWVLTEGHRDFAPGSGYRLVTHSADAPDRDVARGECWVAIWSRVGGEPVGLTADLERAAAGGHGDESSPKTHKCLGFVGIIASILEIASRAFRNSNCLEIANSVRVLWKSAEDLSAIFQ